MDTKIEFCTFLTSQNVIFMTWEFCFLRGFVCLLGKIFLHLYMAQACLRPVFLLFLIPRAVVHRSVPPCQTLPGFLKTTLKKWKTQ